MTSISSRLLATLLLFILALPSAADEQTDVRKSAKLAIKLPEIKLNNATVEEVIEFLRLRALELDPAKKGVNIIIGEDDLPDRMIGRLDLKNVPLTTALRYLCIHSQTRAHIQERNIAILPR